MTDEEYEEIKLGELLAALKRHLRLLLAVPAVLVIAVIVYLHIADPKYSVTLKVTPTPSATSTMPSSISNLAGLTGISLPANNESIDFELYLEGLQSRETSAAVAQDEQLLQQLFAEEWDETAEEWVRPPGILSSASRFVKTILGFPDADWQPPNAARMNEFLDEELRIVRDRAGPVVTIMMEHRDPDVARNLLAELHTVVDSALRRKELDRTSAYVAYLREQLANVAVTEYRQALHEILAEQEKRRMVASSNLPFAAEPFGQPTVSARPTSPQPLLLLFSSVLLGGLLGVVAALMRHRAG